MSASRCFSAWYEASGRPNDHRSGGSRPSAPYIWSTRSDRLGNLQARGQAGTAARCRLRHRRRRRRRRSEEPAPTRTADRRTGGPGRRSDPAPPSVPARPRPRAPASVRPTPSALTRITSAPAAASTNRLRPYSTRSVAVFLEHDVDEAVDAPPVGVFGQCPGGGRGARHQPGYDDVDQRGRTRARERVDDDVHGQQRSRRDHPSHLLGHDREVDHRIVGEAPTTERRRREERRPAELRGASPDEQGRTHARRPRARGSR